MLYDCSMHSTALYISLVLSSFKITVASTRLPQTVQSRQILTFDTAAVMSKRLSIHSLIYSCIHSVFLIHVYPH